MSNSLPVCRPVAFHCVIFAYRASPLNQILVPFPSFRCHKPMVFFQDIVHASTEEEAIATALSQYQEDAHNKSKEKNTKGLMPDLHLEYQLSDNLYLYYAPIYAHQLQKIWEVVLTSMKSFHEMGDTFTKLGVTKTPTIGTNQFKKD